MCAAPNSELNHFPKLALVAIVLATSLCRWQRVPDAHGRSPLPPPARDVFVYRRWRCFVGAALLSATLLVSSCVAVPHSKDIGPVVTINPTDIGGLTREEVLARWGEPTAVLKNERTIAYGWLHEGWIFCGSAGGDPLVGRFGCSTDRTHHLVLIQFDELGRVERAGEPPLPPRDGDSIILTMKEWVYRDATKIGVTTREEIVARFGEPYATWEDKHVYEYRYLPTSDVLLIEFDDHDRVARAERLRLGSNAWRSFGGDWTRGKAKVNP